MCVWTTTATTTTIAHQQYSISGLNRGVSLCECECVCLCVFVQMCSGLAVPVVVVVVNLAGSEEATAVVARKN